jgi:hypothetical protein
MVRCLGELVRVLRCHSPGLSQYHGEDWREYLRPDSRLTLFHDESMTLRLVSLPPQGRRLLPPSEIRLLQGELRLSNGDRIREGSVHKVAEPTLAISEKESAHLEWEL